MLTQFPLFPVSEKRMYSFFVTTSVTETLSVLVVVHVIAKLDGARFRRHKRRKRSRIDSRHVAVATRKRRLDVNVPAGRRAWIVVPAWSGVRRRRAARVARPIEVVRLALYLFDQRPSSNNPLKRYIERTKHFLFVIESNMIVLRTTL